MDSREQFLLEFPSIWSQITQIQMDADDIKA